MGEPAVVKKPESRSALVVFQVKRVEPGATVATVLLWALSHVAEFGGASVRRSPSAKLSFMIVRPAAEVTLSVAGALSTLPPALLTVTVYIPASDNWTFMSASVSAVAPAISTPFFFH